MIHRLLWTGRGYIIALIGFLSLFVTQYVVDTIMMDDEFYSRNGWPKLVGMLLAAAISLPVGRNLGRGGKRERIAAGTNTSIFVHSDDDDSLLFIRVEYWWIIFIILGIILMFI